MTPTRPQSMATTDFVETSREPTLVLDQAATGDEVEVIDHRASLLETVREGWRHRRLFFVLYWAVLGQMIFRFKLGPFWLLLQTFMSVIGYSLIFGGGIFNVKAPNGMPYFLFLMAGMMGWQLFQRTLLMSTRGFQRLRPFLRDLHIPLVLVPLAGSAQAITQFVLYLVSYVLAVIYFWVAKGHLYLQLEPKYLAISALGLLLCLMLAWGIGLWLATLTAWATDFRMVPRYVLQFWLFITPVLYPIEHLHGKTRLAAELNPLSSPVEMTKVGLVGAGSVRVYAAIWSVAVIVGLFVSGVWFVGRFGHSLAGLRQNFDDEDEDMML